MAQPIRASTVNHPRKSSQLDESTAAMREPPTPSNAPRLPVRVHSRRSGQSSDIILIRLAEGGHVSQFGSRFERVRTADHALPPARALVLRLSAKRLEKQKLEAVDDVTA